MHKINLGVSKRESLRGTKGEREKKKKKNSKKRKKWKDKKTKFFFLIDWGPRSRKKENRAHAIALIYSRRRPFSCTRRACVASESSELAANNKSCSINAW
jgi:hypothetical protein